MYALYRDGAMMKEIGSQYGLTVERVRQLFDAAGLPIRSTSESRALQRERVARERGEEICAAFFETRDIGEVARRLQVPRGVVSDVVKSNFTAAQRRRPTVPSKTYTDEELVAFLREAGAAASGRLSPGAYMEYAAGRRTADGRRWPTDQTCAARLGGTWRTAVKAAGLKPIRPHAAGARRHFEEPECIEAVRTAARELGTVPTAEEYRAFAQASKGAFPSVATVRKRCGGWLKTLTKAGI